LTHLPRPTLPSLKRTFFASPHSPSPIEHFHFLHPLSAMLCFAPGLAQTSAALAPTHPLWPTQSHLSHASTPPTAAPHPSPASTALSTVNIFQDRHSLDQHHTTTLDSIRQRTDTESERSASSTSVTPNPQLARPRRPSAPAQHQNLVSIPTPPLPPSSKKEKTSSTFHPRTHRPSKQSGAYAPGASA